MPVVTFDFEDFKSLLKKDISKKEFLEKIPMIGADLDKVEKNEISIEFFPDRPDLASVEGIARASKAFFGFEKGFKKYDVKKSDIKIVVDNSVEKVRPYVVTAIVKNVTMTDELIKSLMELQEKLHMGLGRNRKKIAIGVHNFEPVEPSFTYKAVDPNSVQFVPLNKIESMTMTEILRKHEKGRDYAHLLQDFDKHPLIVDKNDNVLSYPPVINGSLTEVTPFTTELFIDVTGTDEKAINYALNIVVTALAERGGQIYSTIVEYKDKKCITPGLDSKKLEISHEYIKKILGIEMDYKKINLCLSKMGYDTEKINDKKTSVLVPAWRADILHEIDVIEDIAKGFGYENFESEYSRSLTFGKTLKNHNLHEALRTILIGLGFNEVTTFSISNEKDEYKKMSLSEKTHAEIENPIGEEFSCLRSGLIPSLLKILNENRHHSLPQQIFELGAIVDEKYKNRYNLAFVKIDAKANFTECKSYAEAVLNNIGLKFKIKNYEHPGFIEGRCASIVKNNKEIGYFGELHPKTISNFNLEHPIIAFEIRADEN